MVSSKDVEHNLSSLCIQKIAELILEYDSESSQLILETFAACASEQQHGHLISCLARISNEAELEDLNLSCFSTSCLQPTDLDFSDCSKMSPSVLRSLLSPPGQSPWLLQKLNLSHCGSLFSASILTMVDRNFTSLRQLDLAGCTLSSISCHELCEQLICSSPLLESVNLSSSRGVGDAAVRTLPTQPAPSAAP